MPKKFPYIGSFLLSIVTATIVQCAVVPLIEGNILMPVDSPKVINSPKNIKKERIFNEKKFEEIKKEKIRRDSIAGSYFLT